MFLSVEWAKRWLPAIFLLSSLFLPWWMRIEANKQIGRAGRPIYPPDYELGLSFLWDEHVHFDIIYSPPERYASFNLGVDVLLYRVPVFCFVSVLVLVSGLCGLSDKFRIRTLGGLLGIVGTISYFIIVFPESIRGVELYTIVPVIERIRSFPYFGYAQHETSSYRHSYIWFLSVGLYLALAGSLMLLLPLIRTLVEKLRKRL